MASESAVAQDIDFLYISTENHLVIMNMSLFSVQQTEVSLCILASLRILYQTNTFFPFLSHVLPCSCVFPISCPSKMLHVRAQRVSAQWTHPDLSIVLWKGGVSRFLCPVCLKEDQYNSKQVLFPKNRRMVRNKH